LAGGCAGWYEARSGGCPVGSWRRSWRRRARRRRRSRRSRRGRGRIRQWQRPWAGGWGLWRRLQQQAHATVRLCFTLGARHTPRPRTTASTAHERPPFADNNEIFLARGDSWLGWKGEKGCGCEAQPRFSTLRVNAANRACREASLHVAVLGRDRRRRIAAYCSSWKLSLPSVAERSWCDSGYAQPTLAMRRRACVNQAAVQA